MGLNEVAPQGKTTGADLAIRAVVWISLVLALYGLYLALGRAGLSAAYHWITSDSLYPVHVFIDTVLEGNPFSGWKFSIAPCWFPDMLLTALFMAITRNPITATLLAGFVQIVILVLGLRLLCSATGWKPGLLAETAAVGVGCAAAVSLSLRAAGPPGQFGQFFLPQTHFGSMLITVYALAMAVHVLRSVENRTPVPLLHLAGYSVLCYLGGVSDLMYVVQTLVPLTGVFILAVPARVLRWPGAVWILIPGWAMSMLGYATNRYVLNATPLAAQSDRRIDLAFSVFMEGFLAHVRILDVFHVAAIAWLVLTMFVAWKAHRSSVRDRMIAVVFATLGFSAIASVGAVILGGSMTLTVFKNYGATLRYLHPAFLFPVVALPFVAAAYLDGLIRSQTVARAIAATLAVCVFLPSLSLARSERPAVPFSQFRYPFVEYLDALASKGDLKVGVAGYWQARPITLLSRSGVRAYAVTPSMAPFLWVSSTEWYKPVFSGPRPQADFVVLDDHMFHLDTPDAYRTFGKPTQMLEHEGVRMLLYKRCDTCPKMPDIPANSWRDKPIRQFGQQFTTTVKELLLNRQAQTTVPVKLKNPGDEAWGSWGRWPVNLAYRVYRDGSMVSEGERTPLPHTLAGGEAMDIDVRVTAPSEPGRYTVRISVVQEAVAWLMEREGGALELPLVVQ